MPRIVLQVGDAKQVVDLDQGPAIIGRHKDATVRITADEKISRRHARLDACPQGVQLRDLNSRNGTWVRKSRIDSIVLTDPATFRVGDTPIKLTFLHAESERREGPGIDPALDLDTLDVPELIDVTPGVPVLVEEQNSAFKRGDYGIQSIHQLTGVGTDARGAFGPDAIELLNARGGVVHAAASSKGAASTAQTLDKLRLILLGCIRTGASDIHLEPKRTGGSLRLRIDGAMVHVTELDPEDTKRLQSIVKVLCDIDISQKGAIQEGHFSTQVPGRRIDYRVSYTPAMNGQKLVVRVLDPDAAPQLLNTLGLPDWMRQKIATIAMQDTGMLLVCGPTGSGKTTTLYATLRTLDADARNILTIEDPVEYELDGVTQMPVNVDQGATFLSLLRSCLRQDPDVVVLGEVRDKDTAVTAMQAATTGHLVFSTIHAKDTLGIIYRLLDLGVEPYLIASTLNVLLAQRLVRRLCPACKTARKPTANDIMKLDAQRFGVDVLYEPIGCAACFGTGYAGRAGLFEMLVCTDAIRDAILNGAAMHDLKQQLQAGQYESLLDAARKVILAGETSMEEVQRTVGFGDL